MNRTNLKIYLICLGISCLLTFNKEKKSTKIPKKDRIDLAMDQEFLMTQDPNSAIIPKSNLLQANKYLRSFFSNQERNSNALIWDERGPNNVGGRTRALIYDLNDTSGKTVFAAGVSGGLWKTTNISSSNPNWQPIDDFFGSLAICALAQDPNNPQIMYFGTGEGYFGTNSNPGVGLWKSSNGGSSWTYLNSTSGQNFEFIQKIEIAPNGDVYVATKSGLFKSSNAGNSWQKVLGQSLGAVSNNVNDIEIVNSNTIYVTIGLYDQDGIYKTSNAGASWTKLNTGLPTTDFSRIEIDVALSNNDIVYALFENSNDASCLGIFKSANGGSSWTEIENPPAYGMTNFARTQAWYNLAVEVNPLNENHITIGGIDLLKSTNGGLSWTQISHWTNSGPYPYVHPDQHAIVYNPFNHNEMLVGNDGGVWQSTNAQDITPDFIQRNKGYNITQFYGAAMHPNGGLDYFLAGAQDNGSHKFTSPGVNTTTEVSGGDGINCFIDQDNPQVQITSYAYNNYFVSNDGGSSFTYIQLNNFGLFANPNFYDSDANILYASTSEGNVLRWKDPQNKVASFQHIIVGALTGQKVAVIKESPNVPDRLYIGTTEGDVMFIDGASSGIFKTATVLRDVNFGFVSGIDIEVGNENHVVISYSNYGMSSIYETNDGGNSWLDVEGNLPDIPVRDIMISPNQNMNLIVATELGVWASDANRSSNINWSPQNSGMANVRVDQLVYRPSDQMLVAATHGRGLYSSSSLSLGTVPVEISSFDLEYIRNKDVIQLNWYTASEINLDRYVIQKSFDGEQWDEIAEIKSKAIGGANSYQYHDGDLYINDYPYYYRLKIIDLDGSFEYTEVKSIYLEKGRTNRIIPEFFPNPFENAFTLKNQEEFEKLVINNLSGNKILEFQKPFDQTVDLSQFPDGIYFMVYTTITGDKGVEKLIKQSPHDEED